MACAYVSEVVCKGCGWHFTLLLSAPAALGTSGLGFYSTSESGWSSGLTKAALLPCEIGPNGTAQLVRRKSDDNESPILSEQNAAKWKDQ